MSLSGSLYKCNHYFYYYYYFTYFLASLYVCIVSQSLCMLISSCVFKVRYILAVLRLQGLVICGCLLSTESSECWLSFNSFVVFSIGN